MRPAGSPACRRHPGRALRVLAAPAVAAVCLTPPVQAADWKFQLSGSASAIATDNARLQPKGQEESDLILQVTPGLRASREGARLKANINYAPTALYYTQGTSGNRLFHTLAASSQLEAIENFFFVDARAAISQQFLSPFGPQPASIASGTDNRTTVQNYGLSPYIRGRFANGIGYFARNDSNWTLPSGAPDSYSNFGVARLTSAPATVGWDLEANQRTTRFSNQPNLTNTVYRGRLIWTLDPQLRVYATGGYETNNYSVTNRSGVIYGGGFDWNPTPRTTVAANYEERFFGPSYLASIAHRTPLSTWALSATRNLSTFPQQAQQSGLGNTAVILDTLLLARFPDPVQREAEVQRIIQTQGLPATLTTPLSFFTQQVFEVERITATVGLLGVRNTVTFVAFTGYNQTIPATTDVLVQDAFAATSRINQNGISANWSHRLTPITTLNGLASYLQSRSPGTGTTAATESTTELFVVGLTRRLSPKTSGSLNLRYTIFDTTGTNDYREAAVTATIFHTF